MNGSRVDPSRRNSVHHRSKKSRSLMNKGAMILKNAIDKVIKGDLTYHESMRGMCNFVDTLCYSKQ